MGRLYQVDYEQAFALCDRLEGQIREAAEHAAALAQALDPLPTAWVPHGAPAREAGAALSRRIGDRLREMQGLVVGVRQALYHLQALETEQARRMRSARAS